MKSVLWVRVGMIVVLPITPSYGKKFYEFLNQEVIYFHSPIVEHTTDKP
jgi:hypothetical protein